MRRVGIIGGTFDPVHLGHVQLAKDAIEQIKLDLVYFMPAKLQPYKLHKKVSSAEDRLAMLKLVTDNLENVKVTDLEMRLPGISYTIRTFRELRKNMGDDIHLYFITGTDTFMDLEFWQDGDKFLEENDCIVGKRPEYENERLEIVAEHYRKDYGTEVLVMNWDFPDMSSTEIRKLAAQHKSLEGFVTKEVEKYIYEHRIYEE